MRGEYEKRKLSFEEVCLDPARTPEPQRSRGRLGDHRKRLRFPLGRSEPFVTQEVPCSFPLAVTPSLRRSHSSPSPASPPAAAAVLPSRPVRTRARRPRPSRPPRPRIPAHRARGGADRPLHHQAAHRRAGRPRARGGCPGPLHPAPRGAVDVMDAEEREQRDRHLDQRAHVPGERPEHGLQHVERRGVPARQQPSPSCRS